MTISWCLTIPHYGGGTHTQDGASLLSSMGVSEGHSQGFEIRRKLDVDCCGQHIISTIQLQDIQSSIPVLDMNTSDTSESFQLNGG